MANVTEFRNAIRSGLARQHKWRCIINFPDFAGGNADVKQASLLARTANTPSSTVGVIDLPWGGRILPVPGDRTFEEFTVNFIAVNDMNVRNAFERWSEGINGSASNTGFVNLDDFTKDLQFDMLDVNENVTKTYVLKDAWPQMVEGMTMDSGSQDSYAEFQVVFRYVNFESNTTR